MREFDEADEFCPHCDNHFVIEAVTPEDKGEWRVEVEAEAGQEQNLIRDHRIKQKHKFGEYFQSDKAMKAASRGMQIADDDDDWQRGDFVQQVANVI